VGDDLPSFPMVTGLPTIFEVPKKSTESPLSGIVTSRTELEAIKIPPREETETEPTRMAAGSFED
jgi:hypothetical protein